MAVAPNNANSFFVSALNAYQNNPRHLNPDAPAYIPIILHHATTINTSSSNLFCFHHNPYPPYFISYPFVPCQPPPLPLQTVSFYIQPMNPPNLQFVYPELIHQVPGEHHLQLSQHSVDQVHVSEHGNKQSIALVRINDGTWRWGGRLGRRRGGVSVWRVKNGGRSRSSTESNRRTEPEESERNRLIVVKSSVNENQLTNNEYDSNKWRMVKYKACRKTGKKFEIQPVSEAVKETTVMIRNIPSRYTRDMMLTFLDRHCMDVNLELKQGLIVPNVDEECCCLSAYDFFYMPMDFKTKLNKSYAFVNFTSPEAVWRFYSKCDSQKWELFESNKIRQIALAKFQGTRELIEHFERTAFACDCDEFLPVSFQSPRDGWADDDRVISLIGKRVG